MEIKKIYTVVGTSIVDGEDCFGRYLSLDRADNHVERLKEQYTGEGWNFKIEHSYALHDDGKYFQMTEIRV